MQYLEALRKVPLFSSLTEDTLKEIVRLTEKRKVPKGRTICLEGEKGDALYIVLSGKVRVVLFHDSKEYVLAIIEEGGFFGELSLIDGLPRSASVEAVEDSEFLTVKRGDFLKLLKNNPDVSIEIMKTLCHRLRAADERIKGLAFLSVEGRVLSYLVDLAKKYGVKVKNYMIVEKPPSHSEIASFCGCARETVSRAIKTLKKKNLLLGKRGQYVIFPPEEMV